MPPPMGDSSPKKGLKTIRKGSTQLIGRKFFSYAAEWLAVCHSWNREMQADTRDEIQYDDVATKLVVQREQGLRGG